MAKVEIENPFLFKDGTKKEKKAYIIGLPDRGLKNQKKVFW
jgi:hypothetical protein